MDNGGLPEKWAHVVSRVGMSVSAVYETSASIALKPTSSISVPGKTIDKSGAETEIVTKGRHDPCVGLRATPIAEAMVALVLMDQYLRHRAQNADVGARHAGD